MARCKVRPRSPMRWVTRVTGFTALSRAGMTNAPATPTISAYTIRRL